MGERLPNDWTLEDVAVACERSGGDLAKDPPLFSRRKKLRVAGTLLRGMATQRDVDAARIAALEADLAEAVGVIEELRDWAPTCSQDADRADALLDRLGQSEESE